MLPSLSLQSHSAQTALFFLLLAGGALVLFTAHRRLRDGAAGTWSKLDKAILAFIALIGVLAALFLLFAPLFMLPEEDAVILFQFSRNLAHTGAITYIPYGPHAEGATDFAWMVLIAAAIKVHIAPFWTVAIVNFASIVALPFILARIAAVRLTPLAACFLMGCVALFPQYCAAAQGFSVLPFGCLLALVALNFLRDRALALALLCLLLCLFRPDGVVFAIPFLIAALLVFPDRERRAGIFAAAFVLPGLLYFVWRAHYFHSFLPLPFLVKSDAVRFARLIVLASVQHGLFLFLFAAILAWLAVRHGARLTAPRRAVLLCVLLLPNFFYFSMRLDQNAGHRFFIYLPIGAAIAVAMQWNEIARERSFLLRAGLGLWLVLIAFMSINTFIVNRFVQFDNRKATAEDLSQLSHGKLLLTEAGFLAYYSGWTSYDAWGLNTAQFARHLLQPSDVAALQPDAILLYSGSDLECSVAPGWETPYATRTWKHMTRNLIAGIDTSHYSLWYAPYGSASLRRQNGTKPWEGDQECWYVNNASPLAPAISSVLARHSAEPAATYLSHQAANPTTATSTFTPDTLPPADNAGILRTIARTPFRWWVVLSD